jgi:hypothetical protein
MLIITVLLATAGQVLRMNKLLLSLRWRCAFIHVAPLALRSGLRRKEVFCLTAYPDLIPQRAGRASGTGWAT